MRTNKLGRTGLFVSELCLGTMTFGGGSGVWQKMGALDQADAERLVGRAIDAGITFIDTADVYSEGLSEQITGQALRNLQVPRENVVIATKAYGPTGPGANSRGNSRAHLIAAVQGSLKRLQLDHITSTRSTASTRRRPSRKPCARLTPSCSTATSATSACPTGRPGRW